LDSAIERNSEDEVRFRDLRPLCARHSGVMHFGKDDSFPRLAHAARWISRLRIRLRPR